MNMKKIFTLFLAAAAAVSAWADAPELLFRGQPLSNNAEVSTRYTVATEEDEFGPFWIYTQDAYLSVRGEGSRQVTVSVTSVNQKMVQYCGLDGNCILVFNTNNWSASKSALLNTAFQATTENSLTTAPLLIDRINEAFEEGVVPMMDEIVVSVSAYYNDSPADAVTCKVTLATDADSQHNGISDITADNVNISYTRGNVFVYSVDRPTKLSIYNTSGSLVMARTINANGSLSLDSLHPGVYIYSAGSQSGKIIVKK